MDVHHKLVRKEFNGYLFGLFKFLDFEVVAPPLFR